MQINLNKCERKISMKKNLILVLVISLLIQCIGGISVFADGTLQGEGSAESPYLIGTLNELIAFRDKINGGETTACAVLTKNIDASSQTKWTSIGTTENKYAGTFDGAGYEITGIKGSGATWGFFGYTNGGEIKNLAIKAGNNGTLKLGHQSAMVIAIASGNTKITRCAAYGNLESDGHLGGITYQGECTVKDSYFVGDIHGQTWVSGMGFNATAENCFVYGNITATIHAFKVSNIKATTNCYYLASSGVSGTGGYGTQKSEEAFVSGEVAYLLGDAFGQKLGTDKHPVFRTAENVVVKDGDSYMNETKEGDGSIENPYCIGTLDELISFSDKVNSGETTACAILTKDIDVSSQTKWTSIGTSENKYSGTFDGAGYEITGIKGSGNNDAAWGFFAYTNGGEIKNLTVSTGSDTETAIYKHEGICKSE